jgi:signal transduction histidine kinase/HPt (histidine-containing phosphotransfer) domain-containing protein/DNA-binding NarL/FixJ family response regulator
MLLVVIAFALVVPLSVIPLSQFMERQLVSQAERELKYADEYIRSKLIEVETAVSNTAFTVQTMYRDGKKREEICKYLEEAHRQYIEANTRITGVGMFYGFIDGMYVRSDSAGPLEGVDYTQRPWYIAAKVASPEPAYTDMYVDARFGGIVISVALGILDKNDEFVGAISIDFEITVVTDYIRELQLASGGYGVLVGEDYTILAHRNNDLIGKNLKDIKAYAELFQKLNDKLTTSAMKVTDFDGNPTIAFFGKVWGNSYVGIIVKSDDYYEELKQTAITLSVTSLVLMFALCAFLLQLASQKQKSEEESRNKTSFLARMSHEIRTPMNAIIGMSELITRDEKLSRSAYEHAQGIKAAGNNLLYIINDILDFSKIESGKLEVTNSEYSLHSVVNDVVSIIRMRLSDKPIVFTSNIDANIPAHMIGDSIRLKQCLLNLLNNAVKYTNEGTVSFNMSADVKGDDVLLKADIIDSGIGITEENLKELFGDFVQFDRDKNKNIEGTGLGLAITRSLCRLMDGDVTAASVYGQGSTFTLTVKHKAIMPIKPFAEVIYPAKKPVLLYETRKPYEESIEKMLKNMGVPCFVINNTTQLNLMLGDPKYNFLFLGDFMYETVLPFIHESEYEGKIILLAEFDEIKNDDRVINLKIPAHALSVADILNNTPNSSETGNKRTEAFIAPQAKVLIVDDIRTNLKVAEGLMSPYKMKTDTCLNGFEAVERAEQIDYDLIFIDHMMPGMDGVETCGKIRECRNGFYKDTPLIALTANAVTGAREMFLQNGFSDFLAKPIEMAKLTAILDKYVPSGKKEPIVIAEPEPEPEQKPKETKPKKLDIPEKTEENVLVTDLPFTPYVPLKSSDDDFDSKFPAPSFPKPPSLTVASASFPKPPLLTASEEPPKTEETPKEEVPVETSPVKAGAIDGIDMEKGLQMVGGMQDIYMETLQIFSEDAKLKLPEIENAYASSDIKLFTTHVHAIKSASANVGGMEVSKMAAELEAAGKNEDIAFIDGNLPTFVTKLTELEKAITAYLAENKSSQSDLEMGDTSELTKLLAELKEGAENYDSECMDNVLKTLQKSNWGDEKNAIISEIATDILMCEFDGVIEKIDKINGM